MSQTPAPNRRQFLTTAAAVLAVPTILPRSVFGANERIVTGHIGVKNQGTSNLKAFLKLRRPRGRLRRRQPGARHRRRAGLGRAAATPKTVRRLPQAARPQGHRRRGRLHARPLARPHDDPRLPGRQGRLLREAALADRRRGPADGRRRAEARPRRPDRQPAALRRPLPPRLRAGPLGQDRQGQGGPRRHPRRELQPPARPRLEPARRAGLRLLARPRARRGRTTSTTSTTTSGSSGTTRAAR